MGNMLGVYEMFKIWEEEKKMFCALLSVIGYGYNSTKSQPLHLSTLDLPCYYRRRRRCCCCCCPLVVVVFFGCCSFTSAKWMAMEWQANHEFIFTIAFILRNFFCPKVNELFEVIIAIVDSRHLLCLFFASIFLEGGDVPILDFDLKPIPEHYHWRSIQNWLFAKGQSTWHVIPRPTATQLHMRPLISYCASRSCLTGFRD